MNKLLLIFLMMISFISISQEIEYPRYDIDSLGQKVVVMTIEQAQKLDNDTDLLEIFNKLDMTTTEFDSVCIKTINDKNVVISSQKVLIEKLNENSQTKDSTIKALQKQVVEYQLNKTLLQDEVNNLNERLKISDKSNRKMKTRMIVGGGIGGLAIVGLIVGILLIK